MRKRIAAAVISGATLIATGLTASPASADTGYRPIKFHNGLCFDVPNSNAYSGAQLQQWTCNSTAAQAWSWHQVDSTHYQIRSALNTNLCLNNWEGGDTTGNHIALYQCETTPDGLFNFVITQTATDPVEELQPQSAWHTCVNGWGGDASGNQLRLYTCMDATNEDIGQWG
ncbi:RICIN domain-containing protein [Streptomyces sp. NBC_01136]|uniref:RICIN domain-containing protein n=1 Tax=unclassified Streptomyces TaxID=2593676 RepID=UPI0032456C77|nr:RICIN domain-containing protein [Streptomyces sp. NBC_01136]